METVLKHMSWTDAKFSNCAFHGRYIGNRFGHVDKWRQDAGSIVDCDLSATHLHGTDFVNCDVSRISLPSWPHFTLIAPSRNQDKLLETIPQMPMALQSVFRAFVEGYAETSAVVWSATVIAQECRANRGRCTRLFKSAPGRCVCAEAHDTAVPALSAFGPHSAFLGMRASALWPEPFSHGQSLDAERQNRGAFSNESVAEVERSCCTCALQAQHLDPRFGRLLFDCCE